MSFPARFNGKCQAECGESIHIDDLIDWSEDHGGYVHEDCLTLAPSKPRKEVEHETCTVCFLKHPPGSCDRQ